MGTHLICGRPVPAGTQHFRPYPCREPASTRTQLLFRDNTCPITPAAGTNRWGHPLAAVTCEAPRGGTPALRVSRPHRDTPLPTGTHHNPSFGNAVTLRSIRHQKCHQPTRYFQHTSPESHPDTTRHRIRSRCSKTTSTTPSYQYSEVLFGYGLRRLPAWVGMQTTSRDPFRAYRSGISSTRNGIGF